MGVRGFTTYMSHHSHLFFEVYNLHDCYLIIDGSGIAINLYLWHTKSNDCFGGDYDSYANTLNIFFGLLKKCNVTPIILFDGGYEDRKLKTVFGRMRNRIGAIKRLVNSPNGNIPVHPLFVKDLFQDIAIQLGVKCIRNDYESDSEIACLARNLNCPILGYDSDFFFFDTLYIPFDKFELRISYYYDKDQRRQKPFISCQVYKVDTFLNYFGGLDRSNLPLLPVLLGNDYVKKSIFSSFYKHIKLKKSKSENVQQRMIKTIISWLRHETLESAITKVLRRFKSKKRRLILWKLNNAMKGYLQVNSSLLKYLDEVDQSLICKKRQYEINIFNIESALEHIGSDDESLEESMISPEASEDDDEISKNVDDYDNSSSDECEEYEESIKVQELSQENKTFIDKYRRCRLPQCFVDIKMRNMYFCVSQVEDYLEPHSHTLTMNILHCIHKILTQPESKNFICLVRGKGINFKKQVQPIFTEALPTFAEIQYLDKDKCRKWIFTILKIDTKYEELLALFPSHFHLFLIAFYYWKVNSNSVIDLSYIYALILCTITLNCIDVKLGFCRVIKTFYKKYNNDLIKASNVEKTLPILSDSVTNSFDNIDYNESLLCLKILLTYFNMDTKMVSNNKLFDVSVVSKFSQFQSCFLHIKYLNSLFNFPFENALISQYFCGTFLYNLSVNFRKRTNLKSYIVTLLKDCSGVLNCFQLIINCIDNYFGEIQESNSKRTRRRKRKKKVIKNDEIVEEIIDEIDFMDEENKYSLLQICGLGN